MWKEEIKNAFVDWEKYDLQKALCRDVYISDMRNIGIVDFVFLSWAHIDRLTSKSKLFTL